MLLTPLIGSRPVLLLLQDGAILYDVSNSFAVVVLHVTAVFPHHLHGMPRPATGLELNERERLSTYTVCTMCRYSVYHVPNVVQPKILPVVRTWRFVTSRTR